MLSNYPLILSATSGSPLPQGVVALIFIGLQLWTVCALTLKQGKFDRKVNCLGSLSVCSSQLRRAEWITQVHLFTLIS